MGVFLFHIGFLCPYNLTQQFNMNNLFKVNISWTIYLLLFSVWILASLVGWWLANYLFVFSEGGMTLITSFSTLVVAIATILLVIITYGVITATKDTIHGQILLQLSRDYASDDMLEAIRHLREWKNRHEKDFVKKFIEELDKDFNWKYDKYRRRVSHHFYQIYLLWESRVIKDDFITILVKQGKIDFLLDVIKPLDLAIAENLKFNKFDETKVDFLKKTFKFFEQIQANFKNS